MVPAPFARRGLNLSKSQYYFHIFFSSDIQATTILSVTGGSITLQWNESIPVLMGNPQRNITYYEVTLTPRNGGTTQVVFVPAEAGAVYTVTKLRYLTTYDIEVNPVINTEGQGEQTYSMEVHSVTANTTGK